MFMATLLNLPGLENSRPMHWQSHCEKIEPSARRLEHNKWRTPLCEHWIAALNGVLQNAANQFVIPAHSTACSMLSIGIFKLPRQPFAGSLERYRWLLVIQKQTAIRGLP